MFRKVGESMYIYENIIVEIIKGIAMITLNRPSAMNALNSATMQEIDDVFQKLGNDSTIGAVIITGNKKAFAAGADISAMLNMAPIEAKLLARSGQQTLFFIENFSCPVIAACDGFTLGGGCELAMACDIRIASDKAKFGQPEVGLGVIPGYAGTQRLPRIVGKGQAKLLILTGDIIDAQEALRIGLVDKVVPQEELLESAKIIAEKIMTKGQYAVQQAKKAVNYGMDKDFGLGSILEAEAFGMCFTTNDQKEGMQAYIEKRKPLFTGC